MAVTTGQVEAIKDNKRFKVQGEWYGSFNPVAGIVVGDTVALNWSPDKTGQFRNIKSISKVDGAPATTPAAPSGGGGSATLRDLTIIRQNALAHATALVVASGVKGDLYDAQDLVIDLAKKFAEYSATGKSEESPVGVAPVEDPFA